VLVSQIRRKNGVIQVVAREGTEAFFVKGVNSLYEMVKDCARSGQSLVDRIGAQGFGEAVDLPRAYAENRILSPITHPDAAHLHLTGTGLTHLGSAATRDTMHSKKNATQQMTDSMKMFQMGVEGGKPNPGKIGVQPEWFYKGTGVSAAPPGAPLVSPSFALDGGEEPEMAGIYVIGEDGTPFRIGFAMANEFSDHVTERQNYLYLAHSKLRMASFGPEIRLGDLPDNLEGQSRIWRGEEIIFEKPFLSGEANMSHSLANLEHHHFKYELFRQPGDIHVHMFGTATLSFADGVCPQDGDIFEIEVPGFGLALRNPLKVEQNDNLPQIVKSI
jgi:hypothetical protein